MGPTTSDANPTADVAETKAADEVGVCAKPLGRVRAGLMFFCGVTILIGLHGLALVVLDWTTVVYGIVFGGALSGIWLWTDGTRRLIAITIAAVVSVAARELLLPLLEGPQQVVGLVAGILFGAMNVREFEFWRRLRGSQRVVAWPRWRRFRPNVYVRLLLMVPPLVALGFLGWRYHIHVRHERLVAAIDEYGGDTEETPPPKWWRQLGLGWSYGGLSQASIAPDGFWGIDDGQRAVSDPSGGEADELVRRIGNSTRLQHLAILEPNVTDAAFEDYDRLHGLLGVWIRCPDVTDQGLKFLGNQASLESLDLTGTAVSGEFLAQGNGLPQLQTLNLRATSITDAALSHVGRCMALNTLDLSETKITDAGLQNLSGLARLRSLRIDGCNVSIDGLAILCQTTSIAVLSIANTDLSTGDLSRLAGVQWLDLQGAKLGTGALAELAQIDLRRVDLSDTNIGDVHVAALRQFPHFGSIVLPAPTPEELARGVAVEGQPGMRRHPYGDLSLRGTQITDKSLAVLGTLKFLRTLDVSNTSVTDEGVRHLAGMPHLDTLNLSGTRVTDAALDVLSTFEKLTDVNLADTQVTDEGVARFREMNENVWISR